MCKTKLILLLVALAITTVCAQNRLGTVYSMTAEPSGNRIIAWPRLDDGTLGTPVYYPTGGLGTGDNEAGLPAGPHDPNDAEKGIITNNAITLLFCTNGGDNTVSIFSIDKVNNGALTLIRVIDSGGIWPVSLSLSVDERVLYILNSAGQGRLHAVPLSFLNSKVYQYDRGSTSVTLLQTSQLFPPHPLNATGSVQAVPTGGYVMVTEKLGSNIKVFKLSRNGRIVPRQVFPPIQYNNPRGWSFALHFFTPTKFLLACINASVGAFPVGPDSLIQSYNFDPNSGSITLLDEVNVFGGNICWLVLSPAGVWYAIGPTKPVIPAFRVDSNTGKITPLPTSETGLATGFANVGTLYSGGDPWISPDNFLYLNGERIGDTDRSTSPVFFVFKINSNSTLTQTYVTDTSVRPLQGAVGY
jgi:6-phosphogluconolactonase (cycloisomerase 2 family)